MGQALTGTVFPILVRLEAAEVPEQLRRRLWVDLRAGTRRPLGEPPCLGEGECVTGAAHS